mmetsp:Transcript_88704/g.237227  ORF Transcript_88704/g.237227 Transcript_88704/m.237227 type:complete len:227 (+) Transcript_88704:1231-1911(+)
MVVSTRALVRISSAVAMVWLEWRLQAFTKVLLVNAGVVRICFITTTRHFLLIVAHTNVGGGKFNWRWRFCVRDVQPMVILGLEQSCPLSRQLHLSELVPLSLLLGCCCRWPLREIAGDGVVTPLRNQLGCGRRNGGQHKLLVLRSWPVWNNLCRWYSLPRWAHQARFTVAAQLQSEWVLRPKTSVSNLMTLLVRHCCFTPLSHSLPLDSNIVVRNRKSCVVFLGCA